MRLFGHATARGLVYECKEFAMQKVCWGATMLTVLFPLIGQTPAHAQFHGGDIGVARSAAGQLKMFSFDVGQIVHLPPVSGLLNGWADNDPGFDHLAANEPGNDLFTLAPGAQIRVRATAIDAALKIWAPNLGSVIDAPGEFLSLGPFNLHEHLTWHIDSNAPGFLPGQTTWQVTLQLEDTGTTGYTASAPFIMTFSNQPAPVPTMSEVGMGVLCLAMLGAGAAMVRRRAQMQSEESVLSAGE